MDFSSLTVLVVDDEPFSLRIVEQILKQYKFRQVLLAKDCGHARTHLQSFGGTPIDVIVCDFNMPGETGIQLLKEIRVGMKRVARDIPFVMLTGNTDMPLVSAAMALDVDAFIAKPVSAKTLEGKLARILKAKQALKGPEYYQGISTDIAVANAADEKVDAEVTGPIVKEKPIQERQVLLQNIPEGAVLTRPVFLSDGTMLLKKGTRVSKDITAKVSDLNAIGEKIESVWVSAGH